VKKRREQPETPEAEGNELESTRPLAGASINLCFVDEIHGPDSKEIHGYVPTRNELILLAKYWATVRIDIYLDWYLDLFERPELQQGIESRERRLTPYADSRLGWIADLLGDEIVLQAVVEAEMEFSKAMKAGIGEELWEGFVNHDKKAQLLNKIYWDLETGLNQNANPK
jgi:hypothetical protein